MTIIGVQDGRNFTIAQSITRKHCATDKDLQNQDPNVIATLTPYSVSLSEAVDSRRVIWNFFLASSNLWF